MNNATKHKQSTSSSRNFTLKESTIPTARTPQHTKKGHSKRSGANLQKFKSIPTIAHKDIETTTIPNDMPGFLSYAGNPNDRILTLHGSEPHLLYSLSDRNNYSVSKISLYSKLRTSNKKTRMTNKKMSNCTIETQVKKIGWQGLYERMTVVLESYRIREEEWMKEKSHLIQELQKIKSKQKTEKHTSITPNTKRNKN